MKEKNHVEWKICKSCDVPKSIKEFVECKSCVGGYTPRCKFCISTGKMITKEKKVVSNPDQDLLGMRGITKDNYHDMYLFLKGLGYDLSKSIAEQFAERHGLKVKKRHYSKINKYTPDDFGLI
jgi:hypothetical protein